MTSNKQHDVSNHQQFDCLFNSLFKLTSKKIPNFHITGHSLVTGQFPAERATGTETETPQNKNTATSNPLKFIDRCLGRVGCELDKYFTTCNGEEKITRIKYTFPLEAFEGLHFYLLHILGLGQDGASWRNNRLDTLCEYESQFTQSLNTEPLSSRKWGGGGGGGGVPFNETKRLRCYLPINLTTSIAEFFTANIKMFLHFLSSPNTEIAHIV